MSRVRGMILLLAIPDLIRDPEPHAHRQRLWILTVVSMRGEGSGWRGGVR
jgi:hypothetical protein